jgi:hypothetical protein
MIRTIRLLPKASCLFLDFALFYAELTSAGSPDPVTSLILHHSLH